MNREELMKKQELNRVYLEFNGYCNRTCEWCTNSKIKRNGAYEDYNMDWDTYTKIVNELGLIFKERRFMVSFARFNEPLADLETFKKYGKYLIDNTHGGIAINSNSDYINDDIDLKELKAHGLGYINAMDYEEKSTQEMNREKLIRLGYKEENIEDTQGLKGVKASQEDMPMISLATIWKIFPLEDRAGFFKQGDLPDFRFAKDLVLRDYPCYETREQLFIDYNGNVMPCCHMRSDVEAHKDFILGSLKTESITDILTSEKFVQLQYDLEHSIFPEPCKRCHKNSAGRQEKYKKIRKEMESQCD